MKKLIALLLLAAMCLSLAACGKDNPQNNKGEDNIPAMEAAPVETAAVPAPVETVAPVETDPLPTNLSKYMPILCGDWEIMYREDVGLIENIAFSEDGTLHVGSQSFIWEFSSDYGDELAFNILDGNREIGGFRLRKDKDACLELWLDHVESEGRIFFYQPSCYEIVTITLDNWQEYFEIRQFERFYEDAFGDAKNCEIYWELCLKDEYQKRASDYAMDDVFDLNVIETGAVEFSFDIGSKSISVDLPNRSYTLGDDFNKTDTGTSMSQFRFDADDEFSYAGIINDYIIDSEMESGRTNDYKENFEITRIKLDLYLIAK